MEDNGKCWLSFFHEKYENEKKSNFVSKTRCLLLEHVADVLMLFLVVLKFLALVIEVSW